MVKRKRISNLVFNGIIIKGIGVDERAAVCLLDVIIFMHETEQMINGIVMYYRINEILQR